MTQSTTIVDLRTPGDLPAHTAAVHQLKGIAPGEVFELISDEEPSSLIRACQFQVPLALGWEVVQHGPPLWRVKVWREGSGVLAELSDILDRDHARLQQALREAVAKMRDGAVDDATALFRNFAHGLRRHMHIEDCVLTPSLETSHDRQSAEVLREHRTILEELVMLEGYLTREVATAGKGTSLLAGLLQTLAAHEDKEEARLLPLWDRAVRSLGDEGTQQALLQRVTAILQGKEDHTLP